MTLDTSIVVVCFDLGYGGFDQIRKDYSSRFFNVGAAEQAGMDIACGMALSGKKVFVYSITNFLLYRPFETLRTYVNHELIPLRLIASGRDKDYSHDGISHWSEDAELILEYALPHIYRYFPDTKEEIPELVQRLVDIDRPQFISLRR